MAERPNIVLIHWHDLGAELGCYGRSDVTSPNLDSFAADGIRFDRAYCTAPLCSPARGSLFTGLHPHRNGLMGLAHLGWEYGPGARTLPAMLGEHGYRTALIGLQHESADPASLGFDEVLQTPERRQMCDPVADLAIGWLRDRKTDPMPFFATVGFFEVHRPYPPERYRPQDPAEVSVPGYLPDHPDVRADLAAFHGAICAADEATGRILEEIERSGLADTTWIVFTTDHGLAFPWAKSTLYDPGLRVAWIIRPPRSSPVQPEPVCDHLVSHVDFVPTLHDVLDLPVPAGLDGRSFGAWLRGEPHRPREVIFASKHWHEDYDPMRAVRSQRYKLIRSYEQRALLVLPSDIEESLSRRALGDTHLTPRPAEELYDLDADPSERENRADDRALADIKVGLATQLERWQQQTGDPLLSGTVPTPPRPGSAP